MSCSTNSCPVPPDTRPKVVKHIINTNSCPSPVYYDETGIEKHNHGVIKESIENNEVQYYVDSSDIEDHSTDEDHLLDEGEAISRESIYIRSSRLYNTQRQGL